jgi:hypothetical protein
VTLPVCRCGCGQSTGYYTKTQNSRGYKKGDPVPYLNGHEIASRPPRLEGRYDVDAETGCWLWRGTKNPHGYGRIMIRQRWYPAHRVYYEHHVGPIPAGLVIDHLCRVHNCVNPGHLEPVTPAENTRRGQLAKLTHSQVREILLSDEPSRILMHRYGVSRKAIQSIRRGTTWAGVA